MMTNEQLNNVLLHLKDEGVSYKYISKIADISYDSFYYYRRCRNFPLVERMKIEDALREKFGEVIDAYCG